MKTLGNDLQSHLLGKATSLCTCWLVTRSDGVIQGFTDYQEDITFAGVTYLARSGYTASAVKGNVNLSVDNLEVQGVLDSLTIKDTDIRNGVYDYAKVEIFMMNYENPTDKLTLRRGTLGEVILTEGQYSTEIRGLAQALSNIFMENYTPDCQADLGDSRCKINLLQYTASGTVTQILSAQRNFNAHITTGDPRVTDYYTGGLVTFTGGLNAGKKIEVQSYLFYTPTSVAGINLYLPTAFEIAVGDTFTISAGCDKFSTTCQTKFNNLVNFRGFPFIPGQDQLLQTPSVF